MKNNIEKLLNKTNDRSVVLQSGYLMGQQPGQRLVFLNPSQSLTLSEINSLLDRNRLIVFDGTDFSEKSSNNLLIILKDICLKRGILAPFIVCEHYWCVNPNLKRTPRKQLNRLITI